MEELPLAEISCDIAELVSTATPKERKRRHSFIAAHVEEAGLNHSSSWSFGFSLRRGLPYTDVHLTHTAFRYFINVRGRFFGFLVIAALSIEAFFPINRVRLE
ncbi:hypothetical protein NQ314_005860 [Rhamnusium bicolor]|uniref:Uncharacterized protein n=1 Tax=Rhamnusium bicolor TaxID=1586634 RepID=A0AAV8ZE45_9CUCU|nr:hypothetical protein NQ314_005860 [Rhamnusium bicolor]